MQPDSQGIQVRDLAQRDLRQFLRTKFVQVNVQLDLLSLLKDRASYNEIEELEGHLHLVAEAEQLS